MALASRIRKALQYADTIDKAVEILQGGQQRPVHQRMAAGRHQDQRDRHVRAGHAQDASCGAAARTNGSAAPKGFYWGCNNTKDLDVRLETIASVEGRPANAVFRPSDRDQTWLKLYDKHKGKIDADFGKLAFTTPPLAAYHSVDAKFTTTDLAKELKTLGAVRPAAGPDLGADDEERTRNIPKFEPLVSNPWTVLHAGCAAPTAPTTVAAVDLLGKLQRVEPSDAGRSRR